MKKPYIAKDTKEPLVVLGGYEIAEDGSVITKPVPANWEPPKCRPEDIELLEKHGMAGLKEMGFDGVIDRLSRRKI